MNKCALLKKTQKSLNANIFIHFGFKNRTKSLTQFFSIKRLSLNFSATWAEGSG
jgi:hypothetical protein